MRCSNVPLTHEEQSRSSFHLTRRQGDVRFSVSEAACLEDRIKVTIDDVARCGTGPSRFQSTNMLHASNDIAPSGGCAALPRPGPVDGLLPWTAHPVQSVPENRATGQRALSLRNLRLRVRRLLRPGQGRFASCAHCAWQAPASGSEPVRVSNTILRAVSRPRMRRSQSALLGERSLLQPHWSDSGTAPRRTVGTHRQRRSCGQLLSGRLGPAQRL